MLAAISNLQWGSINPRENQFKFYLLHFLIKLLMTLGKQYKTYQVLGTKRISGLSQSGSILAVVGI